MARTEDCYKYQLNSEFLFHSFLVLDYLLSSELQMQKAELTEMVSVHPKACVFIVAILDMLSLILHHRKLLPSREDGRYHFTTTRAIVSILDILNILCTSEGFMVMFIEKSKGHSLVESFLIIFKNHEQFGASAYYSALKLLNRLCDGKYSFLQTIAKLPENINFDQIVKLTICTALSLVTKPSCTDTVKSEAAKFLLTLSQNEHYTQKIINFGTKFFLEYFSLSSNEFMKNLNSAAADVVIYLFVTVGYLHAYQPKGDGHSFLETVLEILNNACGNGLLLKKSYSIKNQIYIPVILANLNSVLYYLVYNQSYREELSVQVTKQQAVISINFRKDLEKMLDFDNSSFDEMISQQFDKWTDSPNEKLEYFSNTTTSARRSVPASGMAINHLTPTKKKSKKTAS
ncbi:uncharacterized protein LOC126330059 isoform X2 [Schistocerca gregaria]|nr:uncharacterized protein LOC126330059 isoform X2 [Schistocerca gregaria]